MSICSRLVIVALTLATSSMPSSAQPAGVAVAPGAKDYLINKDVGAQRWTIVVKLLDDGIISDVAGTVFLPSGAPSNFISCRVRPESECKALGEDVDPCCELRLQCDGADPCDRPATDCPGTWSVLPSANDVPLPIGFLQPDGGDIARCVAREASSVPSSEESIGAVSQESEAEDADVTLTPDREAYLVSRAVGPQRWSISLRIDEETGAGIATGNVYFPDGRPPQFVSCLSVDGLDLRDAIQEPTSVLRFSCRGSDSCVEAASACAADERWPSLGEVGLPASFFLPEQGFATEPRLRANCLAVDAPCARYVTLGSVVGTPQSLSGRTTGHPALPGRPSGVAPCPAAGERCSVETGFCGRRSGFFIDGDCTCEVPLAEPECRPCQDPGTVCEIDLDGAGGSVTASGVCQTVDASGMTLCVPAAEPSFPPCSGPADLGCASARICVDDARGSCDPPTADVTCRGACVPGGTSSCGNGLRDPGEECDAFDLGGALCPGNESRRPTCTEDCLLDFDACGGGATPRPRCGDGIRNTAGEICDGSDDSLCPGRCRIDCTCPPQPSCGDGRINAPSEQCDGPDSGSCSRGCRSDCTCVPFCGDGRTDPSLGEECDGADDAPCPGQCSVTCGCRRVFLCGDGVLQVGEQCDGANDLGCPNGCGTDCRCLPPPPMPDPTPTPLPPTPSPTPMPTPTPGSCGDGLINQPGEDCDGGDLGMCAFNCTISCACCSNVAQPCMSDDDCCTGLECNLVSDTCTFIID